MLDQGFLGFPTHIGADFPEDTEFMYLIANNRMFECEVDKRNFNGTCMLKVKNKRVQGYDDWVNSNYQENDVIRLRRIYDAQGIVRVLIVQNN
jgi:hypothetical protein